MIFYSEVNSKNFYVSWYLIFLLAFKKIVLIPKYLYNADTSTTDIEYNKRLDRQRPCFENKLTEWSNL